MRRFISSIALAGIAAVSATTVWAQDETAPVSQAQEVNTQHEGGLMNEAVGIKPEIGALSFHDSTGNQTTRGGIGLALDLNFSRLVAGVANNLYFGLSTGGLYSHVGGAGSSFIGSSPGATANTSGANLAMFPADMKIGVNVSDNFRISGHGGGNVIYNSQPGSVTTGDNSRLWNIYPNAGADLDVGFGKNIALTLRPDYTFTPTVGIFTGTLELGLALG